MNIKIDLLNKFYQDKYFAELEIVRLSGIESEFEYRLILDRITCQLDIINTADARIALINKLYDASEANEQFSNDPNKKQE